MKFFSLLFYLNLIVTTAYANDLKYRYDSKKGCIDIKGNKGYNPRYLGECGRLEKKIFDGQPEEILDFSGQTMTGSSWNRVEFRYTNFSKAKVNELRCFSCEFWAIDFSKTDLSFSKFMYPLFADVDFDGANMMGFTSPRGNFISKVFKDVNLTAAQLQGADFSESVFKNTNVLLAKFQRVKFASADLRGMLNWENADFRAATYNDKTKLPFSREMATTKGMVYIP